jgi:hypothetical protein
VHGRPGLRLAFAGRTISVVAFRVSGERIAAIDVIAVPGGLHGP